MNGPGVAVVLLVLGGACTAGREPPGGAQAGVAGECEGPAVSLPPAAAAALRPRTGAMVPDDRWADLALEVPGGFAGVLRVDGEAVLMLVRPAEAAAAKAALAPALPDFPVASAEVRQARWDFAQLVDWYNYLASTGLGAGVVIGDKDESANRIRYGVVDEAARERLTRVLEAAGVPCGLVLIEIRKGFRILPGAEEPSAGTAFEAGATAVGASHQRVVRSRPPRVVGVVMRSDTSHVLTPSRT